MIALNRLRYDCYTPLSEADNRIVTFNIDTGAIDPQTTPLLAMKKDNVQPRLSMTCSPTSKTVFAASTPRPRRVGTLPHALPTRGRHGACGNTVQPGPPYRRRRPECSAD